MKNGDFEVPENHLCWHELLVPTEIGGVLLCWRELYVPTEIAGNFEALISVGASSSRQQGLFLLPGATSGKGLPEPENGPLRPGSSFAVVFGFRGFRSRAFLMRRFPATAARPSPGRNVDRENGLVGKSKTVSMRSLETRSRQSGFSVTGRTPLEGRPEIFASIIYRLTNETAAGGSKGSGMCRASAGKNRGSVAGGSSGQLPPTTRQAGHAAFRAKVPVCSEGGGYTGFRLKPTR